jgi:hypothetical protein
MTGGFPEDATALDAWMSGHVDGFGAPSAANSDLSNCSG